ncbi:MAG: hypothetical protein ABWY29_07320 [Blastococcus sp.]
MTAVRRSILLLTLTVTMAVAGAGSTAPAQASFSDSASRATSITTVTVAAPTNVVGKLTCPSRGDATMSATWTASTSARVTGYRVNVIYSDGFTQPTQMPAKATSWSASTPKYNVTAYAVQFSVTTQTDYGWTTESPRTMWFQC